MSPRYYTPGVYFEKIDTERGRISAQRTDIAGFVGMAEKGPLDIPVRLDSWKQFQSIFGGFIPHSYLAYAVYGFFENGGQTCYVVRAAHSSSARKAEITLNDKTGNPALKLVALNEGKWGNQIRVHLEEITIPSTTIPSDSQGDEAGFNLIVTLGDTIREVFRYLSFSKQHARYAPYIVNEDESEKSNLIRIDDDDVTPSMPDMEVLENRSLYLEDGADGIESITIDDLTGVKLSLRKRGLSCFEEIEEISMICIPDIMVQPAVIVLEEGKIEPEPEVHDPCLPSEQKEEEPEAPAYKPSKEIVQPPLFKEDDIRTVQQRMIEHCEHMKYRVAILDAAFDNDLQDIQKQRNNYDSKYAALYYPWIIVNDPLRLDNQVTRLIPPSGHVAGVYARNDLGKGVHWAPANQELLGVLDVDRVINSEVQEILNPLGINCIRIFPGRGVRIWGARTISSDTSYRYINVRRLICMIEKSIETAMQWAVFEPNNRHLRMGITVSVSSFLEDLWNKGMLAGEIPTEAFIIKCDTENNPQYVIDNSKIITEIGVAPSIPGEFIVFRIGRVKERMEVIE